MYVCVCVCVCVCVRARVHVWVKKKLYQIFVSKFLITAIQCTPSPLHSKPHARLHSEVPQGTSFDNHWCMKIGSKNLKKWDTNQLNISIYTNSYIIKGWK